MEIVGGFLSAGAVYNCGKQDADCDFVRSDETGRKRKKGATPRTLYSILSGSYRFRCVRYLPLRRTLIQHGAQLLGPLLICLQILVVRVLGDKRIHLLEGLKGLSRPHVYVEELESHRA